MQQSKEYREESKICLQFQPCMQTITVIHTISEQCMQISLVGHENYPHAVAQRKSFIIIMRTEAWTYSGVVLRVQTPK